MKLGTLVKVTPSTGFTRGYVNLHEPDGYGAGYLENGERLFHGETGLIIQSISTPYNNELHQTYHKILTPRNTTGGSTNFTWKRLSESKQLIGSSPR